MKAFHEIHQYPSDFMVWHKLYTNISFISHWHHEIELIYIRNGKVQMHINDVSFVAQKGDLIICDTGDIHYSNYYEKGSCFDFLLFDTSLISPHYQYQYFSKPFLSANEIGNTGLKDLLLNTEEFIDQELLFHNDYYKEIIQAKIQDLWFHLLRIMPAHPEPGIAHHKHSSLITDFQNLLSYMEDHTSENITLKKAADMMHFSTSYFSKIFKQLTGINFVNYMNLLRITQASEMLFSPDITITQTAYACGFQNMRTFNRVFKEITGYTPSQYIICSDHSNHNFTYYKSNSNLVSYAGKDSPTIIKKDQF